MEMHQIRYFLAVCEELNFTRAAETCHVAQPSLTRAIKLLEEELGGPLFHRERARTHLTEFLYENRTAIYRDAAIIHFNAIPKPWQPWSYGTSKGKGSWAAELVRSRWFSPAESVRWAAPWLGRLLIDATRRSKIRPSSAQ